MHLYNILNRYTEEYYLQYFALKYGHQLFITELQNNKTTLNTYNY